MSKDANYISITADEREKSSTHITYAYLNWQCSDVFHSEGSLFMTVHLICITLAEKLNSVIN